MKKLIVFSVMICSVLIAAAQEAAYSSCDDLEARIEQIQSDAAALDATSESLSLDLMALRTLISGLDSDCRGLSFSSAVDGRQPVLGPLTFEAGVYRATFTTEGFGIVGGTVLDGGCERAVEYMFSEMRGAASDGAQTVLNLSQDCEVLLQLDNITDDWTLTFEKLR